MTATEEALAAMAKAEEAWDKMVDRTVEVSGQFQKECQEFQEEQKEWFLNLKKENK
jgi:dsDNA-binding SOS-regulon protein